MRSSAIEKFSEFLWSCGYQGNCNEMSPNRLDCVESHVMSCCCKLPRCRCYIRGIIPYSMRNWVQLSLPNDITQHEWKQLKLKSAISNGQKKHISHCKNSVLTSVTEFSGQNGSVSCRTLETWHVALLANLFYFIFWPQRMEYCGCTFYLWLVLGLTALTLSPAVRYYGKIGLFFSGSMILAILPIPQFILRPRDYRNAL